MYSLSMLCQCSSHVHKTVGVSWSLHSPATGGYAPSFFATVAELPYMAATFPPWMTKNDVVVRKWNATIRRFGM